MAPDGCCGCSWLLLRLAGCGLLLLVQLAASSWLLLLRLRLLPPLLCRQWQRQLRPQLLRLGARDAMPMWLRRMLRLLALSRTIMLMMRICHYGGGCRRYA